MSWTGTPQGFCAMIEATYPGLDRNTILDIFNPKGFGPVVSSKNFTYIIQHLLRGVQPATISVLLEKEFNEFIPVGDIRDYGTANIPPDMLQPHLMLQYLQKQTSMSEIETLDICHKIALARLTMLMDHPSSDESLSDMIDTIRKLAKTSIDIKVKTGWIAKPVKEIHVSVSAEPKQSTIYDEAGQPIKNITPEAPRTPTGPQFDARQAAQMLRFFKKAGVLRDRVDEPEPVVIEAQAAEQ